MLKDMGIPERPLAFPNPFESDADSFMTRLRETRFNTVKGKQRLLNHEHWVRNV